MQQITVLMPRRMYVQGFNAFKKQSKNITDIFSVKTTRQKGTAQAVPFVLEVALAYIRRFILENIPVRY